jgi:hypothetical protein
MVHRLLKPSTPLDCPLCRLCSSDVRPASGRVRPWCEVKSRRGARHPREHRRLRLRQSAVRVLRDHRCFHPRTGRRWQAGPWRAQPDVSRSYLPLDVHFQAHHAPVSFENLISPDRTGALGAGRRAGCFRGRARRRATTRPPSPLGSRALGNMHRPCTNVSSAISGSRISSRMNCEPGCAALNTCCGSGWPSTPPRSFLPFSILAPARKAPRIPSSTPCDTSWPPFCIPLFTSDGLHVYVYALLGPLWAVASCGTSRAQRAPVAGGGGLDLRPGEKKLTFGASWLGSRT